MEELKNKVGLRAAKRIAVFEIASHFNIKYTCLILQKLCSVVKIGFNLFFFFWRGIGFGFLISHVYFHLDE